MYYFVGFVILLGVLIFVHEFGHFIVAKLMGVKVLKFSLGFPPTLISRKWGETEYTISWIPLGGYVKLLGEDPSSDEEIPPEEEHRTFTSKPLWARVAIIAAGPLSNYLAAMVLFCAAFALGLPVLASHVGEVQENSPAMRAGLRPGDLVVAVDGQPVNRWEHMRSIIEGSAGKELVLTVERNGERIDLKVTPALAGEKDPLGRQVGRVGIVPSQKEVDLSLGAAIAEGCRFTVGLTGLIFETLVRVIKGEVSAKSLGGPVTIGQFAGESLKRGLLNYLFLMSFISINLAIINLLPVPILDGGHLLFFLIEAIIRRPVAGRVREVATQVGFLIIALLMILVIYNDISRIIDKGWSLIPP